MAARVQVLHVDVIVFDIDDFVVLGRCLCTTRVSACDIVDAGQGRVELDVLAHVFLVVDVRVATTTRNDALGIDALFDWKVAVFALAHQLVTLHFIVLDRNVQHVLAIITKLHSISSLYTSFIYIRIIFTFYIVVNKENILNWTIFWQSKSKSIHNINN